MTLPELDTFVDGAAVRRVGEVTFPMVRDSGRRRSSTVPEGRVCTEMLDLYQSDGVIAEPAGALASAALGEAGRRSRRARRWCACSPAATTT